LQPDEILDRPHERKEATIRSPGEESGASKGHHLVVFKPKHSASSAASTIVDASKGALLFIALPQKTARALVGKRTNIAGRHSCPRLAGASAFRAVIHSGRLDNRVLGAALIRHPGVCPSAASTRL